MLRSRDDDVASWLRQFLRGMQAGLRGKRFDSLNEVQRFLLAERLRDIADALEHGE
jgi:hypothetical protein